MLILMKSEGRGISGKNTTLQVLQEDKKHYTVFIYKYLFIVSHL